MFIEQLDSVLQGNEDSIRFEDWTVFRIPISIKEKANWNAYCLNIISLGWSVFDHLMSFFFNFQSRWTYSEKPWSVSIRLWWVIPLQKEINDWIAYHLTELLCSCDVFQICYLRRNKETLGLLWTIHTRFDKYNCRAGISSNFLGQLSLFHMLGVFMEKPLYSLVCRWDILGLFGLTETSLFLELVG